MRDWRSFVLVVACFLVACAGNSRTCTPGESGNLECQSRLGDAGPETVAVCSSYNGGADPSDAICKFAYCVEPFGCVPQQGMCGNKLPSRGSGICDPRCGCRQCTTDDECVAEYGAASTCTQHCGWCEGGSANSPGCI